MASSEGLQFGCNEKKVAEFYLRPHIMLVRRAYLFP